MDLSAVFKFNPNHDELGRFSTGSGGGYLSGARGGVDFGDGPSLHDISGAILNDRPDSFLERLNPESPFNTGDSAGFAEYSLGVRDNASFNNLDDLDNRVKMIEGYLAQLTKYATPKAATYKAQLQALLDKYKAVQARQSQLKRTPHGNDKYHFTYSDDATAPDWFDVNARRPKDDPRSNPGYDSGQG